MVPYTIVPDNSSDLNIGCYISLSPNATTDLNALWLDVNDKKVFTLAKGSLEESAVQFRREEIVNPFIEGKYVVNALRDNVEMTLVIRVRGDRTFDVASSVEKLTNALGQVNFKIMLVIEDSVRIYNCYASDYSVQTAHEMLHARMATVTAQIMHDPVVVLSEEF